MPTAEENQVVYRLEDDIFKILLAGANAVFLARMTCRVEPELTYRGRDPETANDQLERLVSSDSPPS